MHGQVPILELSDVAAMLRSAISRHVPGGFWVRAEILRLNHYPHSGHCYPDLVQKENDRLVAQMRGTIWKSTFMTLSAKFRAATRFELADNMLVMLYASASFHPVYGLSLNITDIEPSFTLGEMEREKAGTIRKLKEEGILGANKGLPMPLLLSRLAIISVETSKGYSDFLQVLRREGATFPIRHRLFPALLQGEQAVASLRGALGRIRQVIDAFDAVFIIRGGGGDAGLDCYNHHSLARELALFPIPVITGIGHSTNETVAEMVAARNLITPTEAAFFVCSGFHRFRERVDEATARLGRLSRIRLDSGTASLQRMANRLSASLGSRFQAERYRLDTMRRELPMMAGRTIHDRQSELRGLVLRMRHESAGKLSTRLADLEARTHRLRVASQQGLRSSEERLKALGRNIQLLSPESTMARGYSITRYQGKALRGVDRLPEGAVLETRLLGGSITSIVKKTERP